MNQVASNDGTNIAFEQSGHGPALSLVLGAFNDNYTGLPLAKVLEEHFTVYNYDRRGRGESCDPLPYGVEREIEDLPTLIAVQPAALHFGSHTVNGWRQQPRPTAPSSARVGKCAP